MAYKCSTVEPRIHQNQAHTWGCLLVAVLRWAFDPDRGSKVNQDAFFAAQLPAASAFCAGVLDGHGKRGHDVTRYLGENLPVVLDEEIEKYGDDVESGLISAFREANRRVMQDKSIDSRLSGTTCVTMIWKNGRVYVANVGDSRAIMGVHSQDGWIAVSLSQENTARLPEEYARVKACGARVDASYNIWAGPIGVAMTRALGDSVLHQVGLICDPEIITVPVNSSSVFVVLVTDGISEVMKDNEIIEMSVPYILPSNDGAINVQGAAEALVKRAQEKWQAGLPLDVKIDDTTAVIIPLSTP